MNVPEGFGRVTPYIFVANAEAFIEFLIAGLGGVEVSRTPGPDGGIRNAIVRFGNASVMLSEATADWPAMPASYYLYVENADEAMAQALAHGATEIMPAIDMDYGDRQGGVRDAFGNVWWLSQRLVDGPYEV